MQQVFGNAECEPKHKGTEVVTLIRLIDRKSTLQEKSPRLASPGKSFIALFRDRLECMHGALPKRFIHVFTLQILNDVLCVLPRKTGVDSMGLAIRTPSFL